MINRVTYPFLVVCLLLSASFLILGSDANDSVDNNLLEPEYSVTRGNTLFVGIDKTYTSIQPAINAASAGDTIMVTSGTYYENIFINKSISLIGNGYNSSTINGNGIGSVITINADWCNITGFTIEDSELNGFCSGIFVDSDNNRIEKCKIRENNIGIYTNFTHNNIIFNNILEDNKARSIFSDDLVGYWKMDKDLWTGTGKEVIDYSDTHNHGFAYGGINTTSDGRYVRAGYFDGVNDYIICESNQNYENFTIAMWVYFENFDNDMVLIDKRIEGLNDSYSNFQLWYNVTDDELKLECGVNGGSVIKLTGADGFASYLPSKTWAYISVGYGGPVINGTREVDLHVRRPGYSLGAGRHPDAIIPYTGGTQNISIGARMGESGAEDFFRGKIDHVQIFDRYLDGNEQANDNYYDGILGSIHIGKDSKSNKVRNNTIINNSGYGIHLGVQTDKNEILYNNFINYTSSISHALDDGWVNNWDDGAKGNHWSGWTSPDTNSDGIVDNPYNVAGFKKSKDHYPLVEILNNVNVTLIKEPPKILTTDIISINAGENYTAYYSATDPDTPISQLVWTFNTDADWLIFTPYQALFGEPIEEDIGTYWVKISVSDGELMDFTNFTLSVYPLGNQPPTLNKSFGNFTLLEDFGKDSSINLKHHFQDDNGTDGMTFNYEFPDGTEDVRVIDILDSTGVVTLESVDNWFGEETIKFICYDEEGLSAEGNTTIIVKSVNDKPVFVDPPDLLLKPNENFTFDYGPYLSDIENGNSDLLLTADESVNGNHVSISGLNATFNYPEDFLDETILVTFTVSDGEDDASVSIWVTITDAEVPILKKKIPDVTLYEGETEYNIFNLNDYFTNPGGDNSYGAYEQNHVKVVIHENYTVDVSAPFGWNGTEEITFRATDPLGALAEDTITVTVLPALGPPDDDITNITIDSDNDGLWDEWELARFGHLNYTGSNDPDGDGFSNLQEYENGTDPNDPNSQPPHTSAPEDDDDDDDAPQTFWYRIKDKASVIALVALLVFIALVVVMVIILSKKMRTKQDEDITLEDDDDIDREPGPDIEYLEPDMDEEELLQEEEDEEDLEEDEMEEPRDETDLLIFELKEEVVSDEKPSDFEDPEEEEQMIEECKRQFEDGELSEETYNDIIKTLGRKKKDKD